MPESVSSVDAILDRLREGAFSSSAYTATVGVVPLADAVAAVHAAAGAAASPAERLREALTRIERLVARWDAPIRHDVDDRLAYEKWAAVGSEAHKIAAAALAAADREAPDGKEG